MRTKSYDTRIVVYTQEVYKMEILFNPQFQHKADEFVAYSTNLYAKIMDPANNFSTEELVEMAIEHRKRIAEIESAYKQTRDELVSAYDPEK